LIANYLMLVRFGRHLFKQTFKCCLIVMKSKKYHTVGTAPKFNRKKPR